MNSSQSGSRASSIDSSVEEEAALDAATLAALQRLQPRSGAAFVTRLLRLYRDSLTKHQGIVVAAWSAYDFEAVRESAHALKSASANIGALKLSRLSQTLEHALREGDHARLPMLVPPFLAEVERVTRAVDGMLGEAA